MDYSWWNLIPTKFDGIAIQLGNFPIHWYGVMYLFAFTTCYIVMWKINEKEKLGINKEQFDSLMTWIIAGILIGARLGYVFFYQPAYYLSHPLEIILPFRLGEQGIRFTGISGMSYHGGLIAATLFALIAIKKNKMPLWKTVNLAFLGAPIGYSWGRFGNFINGELYGEITSSPIGMIFPMAGDSLLHHPSQLYEMIFEGVILFTILFFLHKKALFRSQMMSLYLIFYGIFRFFIEFFRRPDAHLMREDLFGMSRGQTLCSLMVITGIILFIIVYKKQKQNVLDK